VTCKDFLKELTDYLDGAIDNRTRSELEEHLLWCPNCHVICDTTKQTIQIYRDAQPYDLPESLRTKLQKAILSKCKCVKPAKPKAKHKRVRAKSK
jgi:anti-sigma factor RsiW